MRLDRLFVFVSFIQDKLPGILCILQNVKPKISAFADGIDMIFPRFGDL
jgi:hypothetical protein